MRYWRRVLTVAVALAMVGISRIGTADEPDRVFTQDETAWQSGKYCIPAVITPGEPAATKVVQWQAGPTGQSEQDCTGNGNFAPNATQIQTHCPSHSVGSVTTTPGSCQTDTVVPISACHTGTTAYHAKRIPIDESGTTLGTGNSFTRQWVGGQCMANMTMTCRYNTSAVEWTPAGSVVDCIQQNP
jgi:hypothetical protein